MTSSVRPLSPVLVSLGIFVVALALTGGAVLGARNALQAEVHARFSAQADRLQAELDRRMVVVEHVLKGTLATVLVSPGMTSSDFRAYILEREIGRYFPGVRGLGVVETVTPKDLAGFVARERAAGNADFRVRPASPRGDSKVVRFAEPAEANWSLVGQDLRADPVRHEAVQQALRSGRTVLSGMVALDAAGRDRGWMVLVPERVPQGEPARLVFAVLSVAQVMENIAEALGPLAQFQLYDGEAVDAAKLLFDSASTRQAEAGDDPFARYVRQSHLFLGDRLLTLRVTGRPGLLMASGQKLPWIIAVGGALLSALLALAAWLYLSVQVRARRLAADMTADLGRMARVVERTSSAVFGLDLEGRITWANAGFERLTGISADECVGRAAADLPEIAGVDAPSRRLLQQAIAAREARRLELHNQMREGVRYWTDTELQPTRDSEGQVNGFICIATDITRRKQAELRLRANEHLMRVIADNLPAQVSYWDRDRCCRFVNRRFCEVFQRQPEQLTGHALSAEIFGEEFFQFLLPHVERVLEGAPQYFECELRNERGQPSTWQVHYIPDVEAGEVLGFFVLALDVTDLRQARDVAVQASQAKSRFLSSMSHEIRTPLNAVMGMLALLRATPLDVRQRDYAEKADRAARSLLALLNDILDLAKIEAGKMSLSPRVFVLDDLLRDLSVIFAASVGRKDIEVLFEVDPQLPRHLVADDLRLRQVLINLGGNAIKFTDSGEVVLQLRLLERQGDRVRLEVCVRDSGIGLSSEEQARVFSDFVQARDSTSRDYGGTGLGLGICQKLLGLMDSHLQLESAPGRGSRFWFELAVGVSADPVGADPASQAAALKVLVVDDNENARASQGAMAASLGWSVDLAASGTEALEKVARCAYDAVFIDWRMPDMDGWQASLRIRQLPAGAQAPLIIMITAQGREMLGRRPPEEQALLDGFLVKPVTAAMLMDALQRTHSPPPALAAAAAPVPGARQPLAGMRLLLVEDNPTNQQVAMELLAAQGADVELAVNGLEGLERIRDGADRFDAVLMDVLMPVMDGHTAARAVREQLGNWHLPIIAMTANAMASDRVESLAAGMNDHVGKPFSIDELVDTVLRHARRPAAAPHRLIDAASPGVAAAAADERGIVLDRDAAVGRLGGDGALYERLVPSFSESLKGISARLPSLLNNVPQPEAVRLMHTLKGSAATMGATRLSAAAALAEKLLGEGDPQGRDAEALRAVSVAIEETLTALEA